MGKTRIKKTQKEAKNSARVTQESVPSSHPVIQTQKVRVQRLLSIDEIGYGYRTGIKNALDKTLIIKAYSNQILTVEDFLFPEECAYIIKWATEHQGFLESFQAESRGYAHRDNGRIQINHPGIANQIFSRVLPCLPVSSEGLVPRGCSSNIRCYQYRQGQRFGKHIDESHIDELLGGETKFTLLIYLNNSLEAVAGLTEKVIDIAAAAEEEEEASRAVYGAGSSTGSIPASTTAGNKLQQKKEPHVATHHDGSSVSVNGNSSCSYSASMQPLPQVPVVEGGETIFYQGAYGDRVLLRVAPKQGMALLHGHGSQCLTHEAAVVTQGIKYVLRTDVIYGVPD